MRKYRVTLEVEFEAENEFDAVTKAQDAAKAVVEDDYEFDSLSTIDDLMEDEEDEQYVEDDEIDGDEDLDEDE